MGSLRETVSVEGALIVAKPTHSKTPDAKPYRVRVPGFIEGDEIGLGDAIKRATRALGIRPCGGCQRRAQLLNRWMRFTGPSRQR